LKAFGGLWTAFVGGLRGSLVGSSRFCRFCTRQGPRAFWALRFLFFLDLVSYIRLSLFSKIFLRFTGVDLLSTKKAWKSAIDSIANSSDLLGFSFSLKKQRL
jgi:hypothetical protein